MMLIAFKPGFAEEILYSILTDEDKLLDDPFRPTNHPVYFFEKMYESDPFIRNAFQWFRHLMNEDMGWKKTIDLESAYAGVLTRLLQIQRGIHAEMNRIDSVKFSTRKELYKRLTLGKEFLDNNLERKITVEEVSRIASLSPHHFKRTFKKLFGLTPHEYHVKIRLEHSRRLIEMGGSTVSEICQRVGFEDASSFIRLFKTRYGCTPGGLGITSAPR
jgi:AraC-like DNA-binding protein